MNKKLVVAALGVAFAAPVFADASNVTLYGRIHQAIESNSRTIDNATPNDAGNNTNIAGYSSRLGVRGVEDLGGGLSAIFAYEFGVTTDNVSAAPLSTRHAYLGMKGGFGTVVLGSQDGGNDSQAPLYNQAANYIFNGQNNAGQLTIVGGTNSIGTGNTQDAVIVRSQRVGNSIGYATTVAGVKVSARHALSGTDQGSGDVLASNSVSYENFQRETSVSADYTIGALTFGAGYQRNDGSDVFTNNANLNTATTLPTAIKSIAQLGASYNFGAFQVGGLLAQQKYYGARSSDTQYALSTLVPLASNYGITAAYAVSENGRANNSGATLAGVGAGGAGVTQTQNATGSETDNKQFQVIGYYDFSKRTRAYAGYNRTTREGYTAAAVQNDAKIGRAHV